MNYIPERLFGNSGLRVGPLGLGTGHIGGDMDEGAVARLLHAALDLGVTFIDTAPSYGAAEERIGRHLAQRRGEFVLSTKGGYGVPGVPDWTGAVITRGIEDALRRLRCEVIDVFHLHSCPLEVLQRSDILESCAAARAQGKVRIIAYSGEGEALDWAVTGSPAGLVGAVQTSVNLFDQGGLEGVLSRAAAAGMGVVAKRPLANAPWRFAERPHGHYAEVYWDRMQRMALPEPPRGFLATALRFVAYAAPVSVALVGTSSESHLRECVRLVAEGPLPADEQAALRAAFAAHGSGWRGQV